MKITTAPTPLRLGVTLTLVTCITACGDDGGGVVTETLGLTDTPLTTTAPDTSTGDPPTTDPPPTSTSSTTDVTTPGTTVEPTTTTESPTTVVDTSTGPDDTSTGPGDTSTGPDDTSTGPGESCSDAILNQDETDIDCGGASCPGCALGQMCDATVDCSEGGCIGGVCTMVECLADADCDAMDGECVDATCDQGTNTCVSAPANEAGPCDDGDLCSATSLCAAGVCVADQPVDCTGSDDACNLGTCDPADGSCVAVPANEGGDCDDDDLCSATSLCAAGVCVADQAVDCSDLDSVCGVGVCDPLDGQCDVTPMNEGMACDDGKVCTPNTICTAGSCGMPNTGELFYEDFSDNSAGWTLSPNWAIGGAVAGCGDPGTDHSSSNDNGVAGVVLGGCAPVAPIDANNFFCLTSPVVDTSALPTVFLTFWRDLWSDYTPFMKNKIEVFNGNAWVIIFETFGAPETNDAMWTKFEYNITPHKNAMMQVRWCYNIGNGGAFNRGQWNVDDVVIGPAACTPP